MIGWIFDQAVAWLSAFARESLNTIWHLLATTLFHLPDVTGLPQVAALSARSLTVVNTGFVLALMAAAIVVMAGDSLPVRYGVADLLPRLVIGLVAANFATPLCRGIITTANTLVVALTGEGIASERSLGQLFRVVTSALTNPVSALLTTLVGLIINVLLAMLLVGWITRFAALIVAVGIAPVALACHALPWTEVIAQAWWRTMTGLAATVVLQAVALHTSLAIFLDPAANLPSYGLPADPSGLLNLIIVAVLLWVTVRIPALIRRHLTHASTRPNLAAAMVRLVVVHQITRGLGHAMSRAFGRRSAGAGPAAPGPASPGPGSAGAGGRRGGGPLPGRLPGGGLPPRPPAPPASGPRPSGRPPGPLPGRGPAPAPAPPAPATPPHPPAPSPPSPSPRPAPGTPRTSGPAIPPPTTPTRTPPRRPRPGSLPPRPLPPSVRGSALA